MTQNDIRFENKMTHNMFVKMKALNGILQCYSIYFVNLLRFPQSNKDFCM